MATQPDNPSAFPTPYRNGMTLRDWFAGQALPVIIADLGHEGNDVPVADMPRYSAKGAYVYADAMLAARAVRA
jgi:hypothetical protein